MTFRSSAKGAICLLAGFSILFLSAGPASARGGSHPSFSVSPAEKLAPAFGWGRPDYAVRCTSGPLELAIEGASGWRSSVGGGDPKAGSYSQPLELDPGEGLTIAFRKKTGDSQVRKFHLRCLPDDFPSYSFERERKGGQDLFSIQMQNQYAAIFDGNGAPVWWFKAQGEPDNIQVLDDGTVALDPVDEITLQAGNYEIRTLTGRLLRVVGAAGDAIADIHELEPLPNGNYLIGRGVTYEADTSKFGGSENSSVIGIQIQEVTPKGKAVWRWNSRDHIKLAETGRWWDLPPLATEPYDIVHWNAVDAAANGKRLLLSFRHLDAVYEINRRTGKVIWKLGGTKTRKSLTVKGSDEHGDYPLAGQHDPRYAPDGTITVHDNRTFLDQAPRAVRYSIDEKDRVAKLVDSVKDPEVTGSFCCGSARLLPSGEWLIDWGGNPRVGAYDARGRLIYALTAAAGFSYRANPVAEGTTSKPKLRRAMDRMARG